MPLPSPAASLPAKPGSQATPVAGPSNPKKCACGAEPKYTCPRCAIKTCSLPCSKAHKIRAKCNGQRDPAAFVPLINYTQGTWDGDYAWLESTRRQVAEWGEGLEVERGDSGGRGRGRGRGGKVQRKPRQIKLDGLKWALSEMGVDVDILPDGMQRRRDNQSSWNPKSRALYLTVELDMRNLGENVTHGRVHVLPSNSTTLGSLLPESVRDRHDIVLAMPYHVPRRLPPAPPAPRGVTRYFSPLDLSATLDRALEGTAFVEFPQIHVYTTAEWQGEVGNGRIAVIARQVKTAAKTAPTAQSPQPAPSNGPPPAKRVKVDGMALAGLGDYGDSDEDEEVEEVIAGEKAGPGKTGEKSAQPEQERVAEGGGEEVGEGEEDGQGEDSGEDTNSEVQDEEGGDVTLAPEMAAALGAALVADFGE